MRFFLPRLIIFFLFVSVLEGQYPPQCSTICAILLRLLNVVTPPSAPPRLSRLRNIFKHRAIENGQGGLTRNARAHLPLSHMPPCCPRPALRQLGTSPGRHCSEPGTSTDSLGAAASDAHCRYRYKYPPRPTPSCWHLGFSGPAPANFATYHAVLPVNT